MNTRVIFLLISIARRMLPAFLKTVTLEIAFVSLPVILRQMLAASEDEAGGNSPITVFKPTMTSTTYKVMYIYPLHLYGKFPSKGRPFQQSLIYRIEYGQ